MTNFLKLTKMLKSSTKHYPRNTNDNLKATKPNKNLEKKN